MKERERVLMWIYLTGAAALVGEIIFVWELMFGNGNSRLVIGAGAGVLGLLCLGMLYQAGCRLIGKMREEQQTQLYELQLEHKKQLDEMQQKNQQETDAFRSQLAHSLRMPVAIIQGYAELLSGNLVEDPEMRREYMEKIVERSQYMTDVMSRHFSSEERLDAGKLSYEELDLVQLICGAAEDMQATAAEKSVAIQVVTAEKKLPICADGYLLNRVLYNLIENALKYMGRVGTVTVRVQKKDEQAEIVVRDDGFGLSSQETKHIFEPRFQGSNRVSGGGYGLHLVKETVEAHGGAVSAQSDLGRGMSITIRLPIHPPKKIKK